MTRSPGSSTWRETVLFKFAINSPEGDNPNGAIVFDATGNLYGRVRRRRFALQ
ncbi:MAG TPA: hypothetical protein VGI19_14660 [Candidatus Cybelea sp.]